MFKEAMKWSGDMNKFIAITANTEEAKKYNLNNIIEFDKEIGGRYSIWLESVVKIFGEQEFGSSISPGLEDSFTIISVPFTEIRYAKDGTVERERIFERFIFNSEGKIGRVNKWSSELD